MMTARILTVLVGMGTGVALLAGPSSALSGRTYDEHVDSETGTVTIVVRDGGVPRATFTRGARMVNIYGRTRNLTEGTRTVRTNAYVRLLPDPLPEAGSAAGVIDDAWLDARLRDTSPDILDLALQYTVGKPDRFSGGQLIAGDANYGPLDLDSAGNPRHRDGHLLRQPGADFNDFLGLDWLYASHEDYAEGNEDRSLDCSGFIRMILSYRLNALRAGGGFVPTDGTLEAGKLPRTSSRMAKMGSVGTGVDVVPDSRRAVFSTSMLPGDLVFFEYDDDGHYIDHVGMYVGQDDDGFERFISSRGSSNGPTMDDPPNKRRSTIRTEIGESGAFAGFRSARRL